jgi:hypothetical protein
MANMPDEIREVRVLHLARGEQAVLVGVEVA